MGKKTIYSSKWLSMIQLDDPKLGTYIYSHESRCDGKIISVLPYRIKNDKLEFLLRDELTPCWDTKNLVVSSITGGFEKDLTETVIHEMKEEAGYDITEDEIIDLGTCRGTKSSDTVYHLYSVDLTNLEQGEVTTDGSYLESKAHCFWSDTIDNAQDPLVYVLYHKLMNYLTTLY
jgi:8-oxo-dGTP pyrophosphatase MutT (NUDIX family)